MNGGVDKNADDKVDFDKEIIRLISNFNFNNKNSNSAVEQMAKYFLQSN